ncbi:histidine decarboxylase [Vibrio sp. STUT-A11]|uniref:histidine decarboxylase n=1 Tax=Vibrio sp. STUT-A11 TaxID=2976236 RepID=UPI0022326D6E|nr:histidine decarboxylase [Vibrio sp. STUT-A11]BDR15161.1 histidine decarboxylase [Vibrio sp. STUT-A11]
MKLSDEDLGRLNEFWLYCKENQYFNVGYPESADFNYSILDKFMQFSINNCGDWREESNYKLNSFEFEKDVISFFSQLFKISHQESWGYISNGGTEGNLFSCYLARELFPTSYIYYSEETHYSVDKIARLLNITARKIPSLTNGEIDYQRLVKQIKKDKQNNPIIFANIGTTMRGAIDNIERIQLDLATIGLEKKNYYIHADAALSGMIMPFVDQPHPYSFEDGIDSISVSGHKMIGSPIPCGIVLAKRYMVDQISVEVDYISSRDQTISGSRNGHSALFMWTAIKSHSFSDWQDKVHLCLDMAEYTVQRFQAAGINAWRNKNSNTVVLPCPSEPVWRKYSLANSGDVAHIVTMPHLDSTEKLDSLIEDVIFDLNPDYGIRNASGQN